MDKIYYTIYQTTWTKEFIVQNSLGELCFSSIDLKDCAEYILKKDYKG